MIWSNRRTHDHPETVRWIERTLLDPAEDTLWRDAGVAVLPVGLHWDVARLPSTVWQDIRSQVYTRGCPLIADETSGWIYIPLPTGSVKPHPEVHMLRAGDWLLVHHPGHHPSARARWLSHPTGDQLVSAPALAAALSSVSVIRAIPAPRRPWDRLA